MRLWKKLSLLGKAFTNRRELEDELASKLFELQELESNLKGQIQAIESSERVLKRERESLEQLSEFMDSMRRSTVVDLRDWAETRDAIVAVDRGIHRQQTQLNGMTSVVKTLHSKLEAGLAHAEVLKQGLRSLGKVIPWTKRTN